MIAGGATAYDNETAVDTRVLAAHVAAMGSPERMVGELRRSVGDLAPAFEELGDRRGTVIPVRIVSDGDVVRDKPAPVGDMIVGNATYHQQMHYEQLVALREGD